MTVAKTAKSGAEERVKAAISELSASLSEYKKEFGGNCPVIYGGSPMPPTPPQNLLETCTFVIDRDEILRRLPKGGRFAEIGTLYGDFAVKITNIVKPDELHIFDLSFHHMTDTNKARILPSTVYHKGYSWTELSKMEEGYFDVTYVDADHSYASVSKDLEEAYRVTKPGGYIVCNDYTVWSFPQAIPYGVYAAVNEFAIKKKLQFAYFALQPHGFYDVALRR